MVRGVSGFLDHPASGRHARLRRLWLLDPVLGGGKAIHAERRAKRGVLLVEPGPENGPSASKRVDAARTSDRVDGSGGWALRARRQASCDVRVGGRKRPVGKFPENPVDVRSREPVQRAAASAGRRLLRGLRVGFLYPATEMRGPLAKLRVDVLLRIDGTSETREMLGDGSDQRGKAGSLDPQPSFRHDRPPSGRVVRCVRPPLHADQYRRKKRFGRDPDP